MVFIEVRITAHCMYRVQQLRSCEYTDSIKESPEVATEHIHHPKLPTLFRLPRDQQARCRLRKHVLNQGGQRATTTAKQLGVSGSSDDSCA